MSNMQRPPGAEQERPTASVNAAGPDLLGNRNGRTEHTSHLADDQAIWREHTIVHRQPRMAVYWNSFEHVAIRQEAFDPSDEDVVVTIDPAHLPTLIESLKQMLEQVTA